MMGITRVGSGDDDGVEDYDDGGGVDDDDGGDDDDDDDGDGDDDDCGSCYIKINKVDQMRRELYTGAERLRFPEPH